MAKQIDEASLQAAGQQLNRSGRGRSAMRLLLIFLDDCGVGLDALNQSAILTLLLGTWGAHTMTARDLMREALEEPAPT